MPEPLDSRHATAVVNSGFLPILNNGSRPILNSGFHPILNSGVLLVNRPPTFFQNSCLQRAADALDPAAGNGLLAALGSCGKQSAVPACPTAEMGMGIFPP